MQLVHDRNRMTLALLLAVLTGCQGFDLGLGGNRQSPDRNRVPRPANLPPASVREAPLRPAPLPQSDPVRAVWVARFHYHTPDEISDIMRSAAEMGFNTVLWQVRGNGTVAYPSRLEPWSRKYQHQHPGFDPLEIAVNEARRHGLRIEAWFNVMPGWRGPNPPDTPNQLWHTRPDWFLRDADGVRAPLGNFYAILNPCLPEVRDHITQVAAEIMQNYDVDGLHLDYVRYAWDTTPDARARFPRDPDTLRLFFMETGRFPDDDPDAWDSWRANQLTRLVGNLRDVVRLNRPGATLTASVWSTPQVGYRDYLQNSIAWLRSGLLDALYPMAYTDQAPQFAQYIGAYHELAQGGRVIPGLGVYKHEQFEQTAAQLESCQRWGGDFAVFSYASLAPVGGDVSQSGEKRLRENQLRAVRREALLHITRPAATGVARAAHGDVRHGVPPLVAD